MAKLFEETIQDNLNCRAALLLTKLKRSTTTVWTSGIIVFFCGLDTFIHLDHSNRASNNHTGSIKT